MTVDDGAAAKVRAEGKSLLPIGMTAVEGEFSRGDVIAVRDLAGTEIARGQSLMWGGTTYPGCVIVQGALMMLLGAMFVIAWRLGWLG